MAKERVRRKLTTILAADVEGFARLVRADEEATLNTLGEYRDVIDGLVARHDGRIFGTGGDSVLAEFGSAVEAVRCAISIQEETASRNTALADDRKLMFRIGINVGDVMVKDDDLLGDGVNVAARLEGLAEAGGVCVSGSVFEQVRHKLSIGFEDIGAQEVKNIAEPVPAFRFVPGSVSLAAGGRPTAAKRWRVPAIAAAVLVIIATGGVAWWQYRAQDVEPASIERMAFPLPDKPSIAVLPFTNLSDDPSQEYFAHGMTDDLITDLSKISGLFVIARNSSFAYKGRQVKIRRVAEDLGVRYILEGSVRRAGNQVRINAQLIDATTGGHLWAERYDGAMRNIFALQDRVISKIVGALAVELTTSDRKTLAARRENVNLEAYDYLLRGRQLLSRIEGQETEKARGMFEKAIEIDPEYARAYLNLGLLHLYEWSLWGRARDRNLARAIVLGQKATHLDPALSGAHALIASAYQYLGEHDKAEVEGEKAIDLNPTHAETLGTLGSYLARAGPTDKAIELLTKAMRLDPYLPPRYLFHLGWAYFTAARYEQGVKVLRVGVAREPNYIAFHLWLAASYAMLGRATEAQAEVTEVLRLNPKFTMRAYAAWAQNYTPLKNRAHLERRLGALRKAGIPE